MFLSDEFKELYEKKYSKYFNEAFQELKSNYPRINCYSHPGKDIIIEATIPGLTKKDINITCEKTKNGDIDILIKYCKSSTCVNDNDDKIYYYFREIHKSSFSRTISISKHFCQDINSITAKAENGLLTITVPYQEYKKQASVSKSITIE